MDVIQDQVVIDCAAVAAVDDAAVAAAVDVAIDHVALYCFVEQKIYLKM